MKQKQINYLITTEKRIKSSSNSALKEQNRHKVLTLEAISVNEDHFFKLFFSQSIKLNEKFSVGLKYISKEGDDIILARYNGIHSHINRYSDGKTFKSFHKHYATENAISLGIKPEHEAREANYASFEGAILKFFDELNFVNYKNYLKIFDIVERDPEQKDLFDN